METSDYSYRFKTIAEDLNDYIKVINDEKSLTKFLLYKAKEKKLQVLLINNCYYIKNNKAKAILHLNIGASIEDSSYISVDDSLKIDTNLDSLEVSSLILLTMLLEDGVDNFDILLTNNYINSYDTDFSILRLYIRSNNIINLNLNESDCIAESFASYTLSTTDLNIERIDIDEESLLNENSIFRIKLTNLLGRHAAIDVNFILKNAIKMLMTFVRKLKSKVDLDLIDFEGGAYHNSIPTDAYVDIIVKKEFENDLKNVFDLYVNQYLASNLRLEPNLKFEIKKIDKARYYPMTEDSYSRISSFIELAINGTYSVDSKTNTAISSSILSKARTYFDRVNLFVVFRSLSKDNLKEMKNNTDLAAKINGSNSIEKLSIPSWQNKSDYLTKIFSKAYDKLFKSRLKIIKTQNSLDCNLIFYKFNVNMVSLGVKYKQVDLDKSTFDYQDLFNTFSLIKEVLINLDKSN